MNRLVVSAGCFAALTLPALSQDDAPAPETVKLIDIIEAGGIMMYPLALLSVAAAVLILLFLLTIRRGSVVSDRFMHVAESLVRKRDYLGLVGYSQRRGECVARITQKTLEFATRNPEAAFSEIREVAEAEGSRQTNILTQRITYLADIGAIAPMVGLLGTVIGMIKSFMQISQGNFEGVRQMQLASGVSEALVTTAAGLVIGITSMIFYSLFRARVQRYISELEAASTHLMALIASQFHRSPRGHQDHADAPESYQVPRSQQPAPVRSEHADIHGQ